MNDKFLNVLTILRKDTNLFTDIKDVSQAIASMSARYAKEYERFSYDVVVLEEKAEVMVFAKEPFTHEEAREWLIHRYYGEHPLNMALSTPDTDFPVLVSMNNNLYRHSFLEALISLGMKPIELPSCFHVLNAYEEHLQKGTEPKVVFIQEQTDVFEQVQRLRKWYPTAKIVGVVWNTKEDLSIIRFIKSGAIHSLQPPFDVSNIKRIMHVLYPEIYQYKEEEDWI